MMKSQDWQIAEVIARELSNRETDINEFQKVISYVRVQTTVPGNRVGEKFFMLLNTMVRDGRYLVRSGRTMDYYRDLQAVCGQYLSRYRTAVGEEAEKLVEILGWSARLMRYYNSEAGEAELAARQRAAEDKRSRVEPQQAQLPTTTQPATHAPISRQSPPAPPRSETKREKVTLTTAAKSGKAQVKTESGEEIVCSSFPSYPPSKAGEVCWADVTREGGKAVRAVFKKWG